MSHITPKHLTRHLTIKHSSHDHDHDQSSSNINEYNKKPNELLIVNTSNMDILTPRSITYNNTPRYIFSDNASNECLSHNTYHTPKIDSNPIMPIYGDYADKMCNNVLLNIGYSFNNGAQKISSNSSSFVPPSFHTSVTTSSNEFNNNQNINNFYKQINSRSYSTTHNNGSVNVYNTKPNFVFDDINDNDAPLTSFTKSVTYQYSCGPGNSKRYNFKNFNRTKQLKMRSYDSSCCM